MLQAFLRGFELIITLELCQGCYLRASLDACLAAVRARNRPRTEPCRATETWRLVYIFLQTFVRYKLVPIGQRGNVAIILKSCTLGPQGPHESLGVCKR